MIKNKKKFLIFSGCLTILIIYLVIMNEQSINQVSELCINLGGTPDVDKNILTGNWSVNCHRPPISVNQ